jgi:hypothetical protein
VTFVGRLVSRRSPPADYFLNALARAIALTIKGISSP